MIDRFITRNTWISYTLLWIILTVIHIVLLAGQYRTGTLPAILDGLIFNGIYAFLGVGLYFMVRYSGGSVKGFQNLAVYHLTGVALTLAVWMGSGYLLMKLVIGADHAYMNFLDGSIIVRLLTGFLFYFLIVTVFYLTINIRELREKAEHEASLTTMLRDAELNMLRSQIRPHFLFNSLNSVSALTMTDPAKAQEMVIKLSEFMRYSLSVAGDAMSTVEKELHNAQLYLEIEKVRFSDRMSIETEVDPACLAQAIPVLILQPLLENAVKHGVNTLARPSVIRLALNCADGNLRALISNEFDPAAAPRKGTGTGLQNVQRRMAAVYGRYDLVKTGLNGIRFEVELLFPQAGFTTQNGTHGKV